MERTIEQLVRHLVRAHARGDEAACVMIEARLFTLRRRPGYWAAFIRATTMVPRFSEVLDERAA